MPTVDEVTTVLATINDPELHRSIVELGMVKNVEITDSLVTVDLALTIAGCPLKSYFQEVLPAKIKDAFPPITDVQVNLGAMSEQERKNLIGGIRGGETAPLSNLQDSTNVVAIASGKGGVGKSSVTVNLAAALADRGHKVGLLDADIWGFSIARMLGISTQPTVLDERLIIPLEAHGVKMISMGNLVDDDRPIIMRGPMLHKILQGFLSDVHWEEPDYLLIDMPPGTGDISLSLSQFVPGAQMALVTTPQQAAERVAERAGAMAIKVGMKLGGVIENMAYAICEHCGEKTHPFGEGGGQALAERNSVPLLGRIPLDPAIVRLADAGKPIVTTMPDSLAAEAFRQTADRFMEQFPIKPKKPKRIHLPLITQPAQAHSHGAPDDAVA